MSVARLAILALTTCTALAGQEVADGPNTTTRFAWPMSGSLSVVDTTQRDGKTVKVRYRLELSRADDGVLRVASRDLEFLEVDGRTVPAKVKAALTPAPATQPVMPDLVIGPDGRFVRADRVEELLKQVIDETTERHGEAAGQRMRRVAAQPAAQKMLLADIERSWQTWVGAWCDWPLQAGGDRETATTLPLFDIELPARQTASHLGAVEGQPGLVRLRLRATTAGEDAEEALTAFRHALTARPASAPKIAPDAVREVSVTDEMSVVTDPSNLRPLHARSERLQRLVRIDPDTGERETLERLERHEYEFDWGTK